MGYRYLTHESDDARWLAYSNQCTWQNYPPSLNIETLPNNLSIHKGWARSARATLRRFIRAWLEYIQFMKGSTIIFHYKYQCTDIKQNYISSKIFYVENKNYYVENYLDCIRKIRYSMDIWKQQFFYEKLNFSNEFKHVSLYKLFDKNFLLWTNYKKYFIK